ENRIRRGRRRHVDHSGGGAGLAHRVLDGVEHRQSQVLLSATPGGHAAEEFGAVGERGFGVKATLLAGESLADDARFRVDQNAHALPFAASCTTLRAASVRSDAGVIASPLFKSMERAASAFV